jgi:hypothetical protein
MSCLIPDLVRFSGGSTAFPELSLYQGLKRQCLAVVLRGPIRVLHY